MSLTRLSVYPNRRTLKETCTKMIRTLQNTQKNRTCKLQAKITTILEDTFYFPCLSTLAYRREHLIWKILGETPT